MHTQRQSVTLVLIVYKGKHKIEPFFSNYKRHFSYEFSYRRPQEKKRGTKQCLIYVYITEKNNQKMSETNKRQHLLPITYKIV